MEVDEAIQCFLVQMRKIVLSKLTGKLNDKLTIYYELLEETATP